MVKDVLALFPILLKVEERAGKAMYQSLKRTGLF